MAGTYDILPSLGTDEPVSVSVAVWTLVAISLERYFAICRPLSSRRWQTQFHAYKMIGLVWTVSFLANSPLCYVQRLQPVGRTTGQMKCREVWPDRVWEKAYVLFHDVGLLFLPLLTMGFAYSMIVSKLWRGLRHEIKHSSLYQQTSKPGPSGPGPSGGCAGAGGVAVGTGPGVTGNVGGEQHTHPTAGTGPGSVTTLDAGKTLKTCGSATGKRLEAGFVLTSSLKKAPFKASTAVVNFASNNNTIGKGNFNGSGNGGGNGGGNANITTTNGAGTSGNPCSSGASNCTNNGSNGANTDRSGSLYCGGVGCECRTGRLRGFRHFFAKQQQHQHGGLCRNHRYHLSSTSPEGLPELAETKFDEAPAHQQHPYHHHCHHAHGYHHHHHQRMPTTIVKSTQQDAKHEIVLSTGEPGPLDAGPDGGIGPGTGSTNALGASSTMPTVNATTTATGDEATLKSDPSYQFSRHAIRSTYMDKSIEAKKKVYLYSPSFVYQYVNSSGIALVQLMAYISSCCNPITYCFMNRRFRQAFLGIFSCYRNRMPICCCFCCTSKNGPMDGVESKTAAYLRQNTINQSGAERNNSDMSGNDSLVYVGRGLVQRSGKCPPPSSMIHRPMPTSPGIIGGTGSDHVNSSVSIVNSISSARIAQIIETDPDDDSFRLRITWSKPTSANYSKTAGGCDSERYS
uniref:G-protein coupled receptors family 1 profile domain-containing protein n=1 Tax=Anopheles culicifacies TaxID=139723 RepID=A0A182MNU7_9DIPT